MTNVELISNDNIKFNIDRETIIKDSDYILSYLYSNPKCKSIKLDFNSHIIKIYEIYLNTTKIPEQIYKNKDITDKLLLFCDLISSKRFEREFKFKLYKGNKLFENSITNGKLQANKMFHILENMYGNDFRKHMIKKMKKYIHKNISSDTIEKIVDISLNEDIMDISNGIENL